MLLVAAQGFWRALLAMSAPLLLPLRALADVGAVPRSTASALVVLAALLVAPITAPVVPATPSATLAAVSGMLRRVRAGVTSAVFKAPVSMASGAVARTVVAVLDMLLSFLPPVDDNVTATSMMRELGYPMETHFVTTKDGYRLRLDRVPNPGRQPVFVAHGMQTASPAFVLLGRGKALAPLLHDAGFDVWMVNFRGTHYSLGHNKYSPRDEQFWNFSFHEHGVLDNPAAIDYVLARTRFPGVMYASHSMGSTSFLIMAAARPEYQRKVRAAFLIAPAGPLHRHTSPVVGLLHAVNNVTQPLVDGLGLRRTMLPFYRVCRRMIKLLLPYTRPFMYMLTYAIVGYKNHEKYYDLPHFWDTIPSGGSWGEVFHYVQNANHDTQGFRHYDHGAKRNRELYGSPEPPLYNLSAIQTPVHMYLSQNDILCSKTDMDYLCSQMPNVASVYVDPDETLNHMDCFASPSGAPLNQRVVADILRVTAEQATKAAQPERADKPWP